MTRAPLRFLVIVLALWVGARAAILLPGRTDAIAPIPAAAAASPAMATATPAPVSPLLPVGPVELLPASSPSFPPGNRERTASVPLARPAIGAGTSEPAALLEQQVGLPVLSAWEQPAGFTLPPPPSVRPASSRLSLSAWLLVRNEGGAALAPGGTLGGSQAGARVIYALGHGVGLSGRVYLPLRHIGGAELAAGIDWRPFPSLPVNLIAERRQRLGRDGRNAFALALYGGASRALTPRVRLDAYGQAGMVGLSRRDLFADGAIRLARRIGPVEVGAGAWGAAQPGAGRLDAGPSLSWRLPVRSANLRLQADWRFRVAGDAAPRSGPSLTLAADF